MYMLFTGHTPCPKEIIVACTMFVSKKKNPETRRVSSDKIGFASLISLADHEAIVLISSRH